MTVVVSSLIFALDTIDPDFPSDDLCIETAAVVDELHVKVHRGSAAVEFHGPPDRIVAFVSDLALRVTQAAAEMEQ